MARMAKRPQRNAKRTAVETLTRQPIYRVARTSSAAYAIAAGDQGTANYVTPANFSNWADLSAVYDLYRITKLEYKFVCWRAAAPATTGDAFPTLISAVDFNDTTAPASSSELLEYSNVKVQVFQEGTREITRTLVPKLQLTSSGTNTVLGTNNTWARTSVTTDAWLGLKTWLVNFNSTTYNNTVITLYVTADFEFKMAK